MSETARTDEARSVLEHIGELRRTLFVALLAFVAGATVAHVFHSKIISLILAPSLGQKLVFLSPLEPLFFILKIDLIAGLVLSFPVIVWAIFTYIQPALSPRLRVALSVACLVSFLLLVAGMLYAYLVIIPMTLKFLYSIVIPGVENMVTMENYLGFFFAQLLIIMLIFQIPILIVTGLRLGLFNVRTLSSKRRYVYLVGTIALAVLTPTTDVFSLAIVLVPSIVIFEVSLLTGLVMQFFKKKTAQ